MLNRIYRKKIYEPINAVPSEYIRKIRICSIMLLPKYTLILKVRFVSALLVAFKRGVKYLNIKVTRPHMIA